MVVDSGQFIFPSVAVWNGRQDFIQTHLAGCVGSWIAPAQVLQVANFTIHCLELVYVGQKAKLFQFDFFGRQHKQHMPAIKPGTQSLTSGGDQAQYTMPCKWRQSRNQYPPVVICCRLRCVEQSDKPWIGYGLLVSFAAVRSFVIEEIAISISRPGTVLGSPGMATLFPNTVATSSEIDEIVDSSDLVSLSPETYWKIFERDVIGILAKFVRHVLIMGMRLMSNAQPVQLIDLPTCLWQSELHPTSFR